MVAAYEDVPFSELLHHPAATAERLSQVRALRLRRRDAADLVLMRVEQLERDEVVVDFASRLIAGLIRSGNAQAIRDVLPDALPWMTFLPDDDASEFLAELAAVIRGATDLDNLAPVAVLLAQWQHSAEIHADPALLELMTGEPEGDFGPVPAPVPGL
ncbi:MAG TPA: DUF6247 family protein [Streptosporangiaceae bacterium]|nr:DUF6247 family protein [Streptosporangiaceae bacterium]